MILDELNLIVIHYVYEICRKRKSRSPLKCSTKKVIHITHYTSQSCYPPSSCNPMSFDFLRSPLVFLLLSLVDFFFFLFLSGIEIECSRPK